MVKRTVLLCFSIIIAFAIAELIVRKALHIKPGIVHVSPWFKEVDSLKELRGYIVDESGIMQIDPVAGQYADSIISNYTYSTVPPSHYQYLKNNEQNGICNEIYGLDHFYLDLKQDTFNNALKGYIAGLEKDGMDDADSAVIAYASSPVNEDGFRSMKFKKYQSGKKKILLIGDSFTFGHEATNLTNSFADILLTKGYVVFNCGITFTDPAQYLAVAKKYVPLLQPDVVIINFFMGNDIFYFDRVVGPPEFYVTNAGYLDACPNGIYLGSAKETYDFISSSYHIPTHKNLFNRICAVSSIGTILWNALNNHGLVDATPVKYEQYWKEVDRKKTETPACNGQMKMIEKICRENGAKFLLVVIPNTEKSHQLRYPPAVPDLFSNCKYFVPNVKYEDYTALGGHYNDSGHKKHAEFLDSLIRTVK